MLNNMSICGQTVDRYKSWSKAKKVALCCRAFSCNLLCIVAGGDVIMPWERLWKLLLLFQEEAKENGAHYLPEKI